MKKITFLVTVFVLAMSTLSATALTTNVFDTFEDGNKLATGSLDGNWYSALSQGQAVITNDTFAGGGSTKALLLTSPDSFRRMSATFAGVTLGSTSGDTITLSFDMRLTSAIANNAFGFRFGLYNSAGTSITNDNPNGLSQPTQQNDDFGYFVRFGTGANSPANNNLLREPGIDNPTGGDTGSQTILSTNTVYSINDSLKHSFTLQLMRTNTTQMALAYWYDGNLVSGVIQASPLTSSFDTIYFAKGSVTTDFAVDNVLLTSIVIPEPSTGALIGVGLLGVWLLRQRRR
jgi:hypothetical protein